VCRHSSCVTRRAEHPLRWNALHRSSIGNDYGNALRERSVDVTHVEAFLGLMADVNANHEYLVCPYGYTKAAERRAQSAVSIRLLPLDRMDNL